MEQFKDITPSILIAWILGGIVYSFSYLNVSVNLTLVLQVLVGAIVYIGLAKMFKIESFDYLVETMKQLIKSRKGASAWKRYYY